MPIKKLLSPKYYFLWVYYSVLCYFLKDFPVRLKTKFQLTDSVMPRSQVHKHVRKRLLYKKNNLQNIF